VDSCLEVKESLLWWIPSDDEQSGAPDFEMYRKIGGWDKPYMKLFKSVQVCG